MNHKYHKYNAIENMMMDIIIEGQKTVWRSIEEEKDAWKRIKQREIFTKALKQIKKGKI